MNRTVKIEYAEGKFMEMEISPNFNKTGGGLGGAAEKLQEISKTAFEKSLSNMTGFLKNAAITVQKEFEDTEIGDITISMGVAMNLGGEFVISVGAETNFNIEVTLKR